ncbi:hypothetical protein DERP_005811 [Dermatophagoides pteronyssinus]|uniref:Uncharacterized protein n=1 Tax=Dermatophagoides pteronyssinus TaxID=6956 RepID=A0ABQ8J9P6_DERPT|nr:hypothetical protein DERP_005811 [Dermatophagoides pteronyssinus]
MHQARLMLTTDPVYDVWPICRLVGSSLYLFRLLSRIGCYALIFDYYHHQHHDNRNTNIQA